MGENIHPPMKPAEELALAKPSNILTDVLPLFFLMGFMTAGKSLTRFKYGTEAGDAVWATLGIVLLFPFFWYVKSVRRKRARRYDLIRQRYQNIYRVLSQPPELSTFNNHPLAKIEVGDYGWEAPPLADDGLIYLQGLTPDWKLVWHAGFHPDQIEKVGLKPQSQYDNPQESDSPICPYPIVERQTRDLGLPQ